MEAITKWCNILPFPKQWKKIITDASKDFDRYRNSVLPMYNLLKTLCDCEQLAADYQKMKISESILIDTLKDVVVWTKNYHTVSGEIGLTEMDWIKSIMEMRLFRLGRLQFRYGEAKEKNERLKIKTGDPVTEVHIPQGEPLDIEACKKSFEKAVVFFERYYPQCSYKYFCCESWLLDFHLKDFLNENSNIIKFQSLFDIVSYFESGQAVERLFTYNADKLNESSLQRAVKNHIKNGGKLFEGYGFADKEKFTEGV